MMVPEMDVVPVLDPAFMEPMMPFTGVIFSLNDQKNLFVSLGKNLADQFLYRCRIIDAEGPAARAVGCVDKYIDLLWHGIFVFAGPAAMTPGVQRFCCAPKGGYVPKWALKPAAVPIALYGLTREP